MKFIFAGMLLLCVCVQFARSNKCYDCYGNQNCENNPRECEADKQNCFKFNGEGLFVKGCASKVPGDNDHCEEGEFQQKKGTICMCTTNLCNNAQVNGMDKMMMFSVALVAVLMQKFM